MNIILNHIFSSQEILLIDIVEFKSNFQLISLQFSWKTYICNVNYKYTKQIRLLALSGIRSTYVNLFCQAMVRIKLNFPIDRNTLVDADVRALKL